MNYFKLTEQTQRKLSVLLDLVVYLEKRMYADQGTTEEWNTCFEIKQDIKDTIFAELRARVDETPS